jgi:hypothetical protein
MANEHWYHFAISQSNRVKVASNSLLKPESDGSTEDRVDEVEEKYSPRHAPIQTKTSAIRKGQISRRDIVAVHLPMLSQKLGQGCRPICFSTPSRDV